MAYRPLRVAQYRLYKMAPPLTARWTGSNGGGPVPATETAGVFRKVFRESFAHLNTPLAEREAWLADLSRNRFTFLNRSLTLEPVDWNRRYEGHLWNYQLHYFHFAIPSARALVERNEERAWRACRSLIESWIGQARVGRSDGWDPYPISLRVVNWMYAYALTKDACGDSPFLERWLSSIHRQVEFLSRHLEFHLLANHLLKNVKALLIGGLFFERRDWVERGERLLWREFGEQVLEDGGHYERAPMYHAQSLADLLECYALLKAFRRSPAESAGVEARLRSMAGFLEAMAHGDGSLALFNDSANTEDTRPRPILETAKRVCGYVGGDFPDEFPQTGYHLWSAPDGSEKIIVDAGAASVGYNTAHAHCDLLSYELWLDGRPFIVDSGVHGYGEDPFREYCRSTRAHNTVMFDGREQSEVWGTFRIARRAGRITVGGGAWAGEDASWRFLGRYSPFYDKTMIHERRIWRTRGGDWVVRDIAMNSNARRAASFIHLHPDVTARVTGTLEGRDGQAVECQFAARGSRRKFIIQPFNAEAVKIVSGEKNPVQGWYFSDFGIARPAATIIFEFQMGTEPGDFGYTIKRPTGE
jgi:uncharacterized heparinase superfamily protein